MASPLESVPLNQKRAVKNFSAKVSVEGSEPSTNSRSCEKLLDQNITQVTGIRRLGRGQSIGSRCDKFNAPPPPVSEASSSNQPFNAVNGRGSSATHRPWHSKLRRGRVEFIAP